MDEASTIEQLYQELNDRIVRDLSGLIVPWQTTMTRFIEANSGERGNVVDVSTGAHSFSTDTTPKSVIDQVGTKGVDPVATRVRVDFGITDYSLLDLSLYFFLNLNGFEGQEYVIVPAFIPAHQVPPNTVPELAMPITIKKFNMKDPNIYNQISSEISQALAALNAIFEKEQN